MSTVRVSFTKWGDHPHWTFDATRLGADEHGSWLGLPVVDGTGVSAVHLDLDVVRLLDGTTFGSASQRWVNAFIQR